MAKKIKADQNVEVKETVVETTEKLQNVVKENIEAVKGESLEKPQITKEEFIDMLFTNKKFKFIPNKKLVMQKVRKMSEEEFQGMIGSAFAHIINNK